MIETILPRKQHVLRAEYQIPDDTKRLRFKSYYNGKKRTAKQRSKARSVNVTVAKYNNRVSAEKCRRQITGEIAASMAMEIRKEIDKEILDQSLLQS